MFKLILLLLPLYLAITTNTLIPNEWLNRVGYCRVSECCHENDGTGYLLYNKGVEKLRLDLKLRVHGQPLIHDPIYRSLMTHMVNERPSRPLVMYFCGWTGTGKTHVAKLIAKNLYSKGMDSKYVSYISSSLHFPVRIESEHEIDVQRGRLRDMIRNKVQQCERSLIILDELDKLPAGVVDVLQPMFDYVESVDGVRYSKTIFIFLSNTGATKLNNLSFKMYKEGKERKDLRSKDIEEVLFDESLKEPGGLHESSVLRRHSIGVFVPFLPLEREHVRECIRDEIKLFYDDEMNNDRVIDEIGEEMTYFPDEIQMYSKSGCKGVHDKVINHLGVPTRIKNLIRTDL